MNKLQKIITTGLVVAPLIVNIPGCKKAENETNTNQTKTEQTQEDNQLRNTILSYLSQPKFSNSDFMEQITETKAKLQMLDLRENMVYISIPKKHFTKKVLKELAVDPNLIEFGKTTDGKFSGNRIKLGGYVLKKQGNYFFRFPSNNFRVDETDKIIIPYQSTNYSINMQELQDFVSNKSVFGGYLNADTGTDNYGRHQIIANHGAFVAKKGESSLEKLVNSLTKNKSTKEGKAQRLLDFVTEELKYDYSDANSRAIKGMSSEDNHYRGILYLGGIVVNGKPMNIEYNARWGDPECQTVLPSVETYYVDMVMACLEGKLNELEISQDNKTRVCVVGASRGYPNNHSKVKNRRIYGLEEAMGMDYVSIFGAGIDVQDGKFYANGGRLFSIVGEGSNILEAKQRAYSAMAHISIEGNNLYYRTDIGWRDVERFLREHQ